MAIQMLYPQGGISTYQNGERGRYLWEFGLAYMKNKGFSLIELLIVVAIILIIAAIAIPNLLRSKQSANEAAAVSVLRNVHNSQAVYMMQFTNAIGYANSLIKLGPWRSVRQNHACLSDQLVGCAAEPCLKSGYMFYMNSTSAAAPFGDYTSTATPVVLEQLREPRTSAPQKMESFAMKPHLPAAWRGPVSPHGLHGPCANTLRWAAEVDRRIDCNLAVTLQWDQVNVEFDMHAIEIRGLSKDYPVGFWKKKLRPALKSLDLTVEAGETFGFLGPNGAGKTTTLKLLMGIIFPTRGIGHDSGQGLPRS